MLLELSSPLNEALWSVIWVNLERGADSPASVGQMSQAACYTQGDSVRVLTSVIDWPKSSSVMVLLEAELRHCSWAG
jgi:hypothetical protein